MYYDCARGRSYHTKTEINTTKAEFLKCLGNVVTMCDDGAECEPLLCSKSYQWRLRLNINMAKLNQHIMFHTSNMEGGMGDVDGGMGKGSEGEQN